ncbi:MAG: hypothetical protein AMXMBFR84_29470 [Candidatus Hydrogenedentota bacterium]
MKQDELREQFSPLLDDELDVEEREALEAALAQDSALLRDLDGYKRVDALYRALPREGAPADFELRVKQALRPTVISMARRRIAQMSTRAWIGAAAGLLVASAISVYVIPGRLMQQEMAASHKLAMPDFAAETAPAGSAEAAQSSPAATFAEDSLDRLGGVENAPAPVPPADSAEEDTSAIPLGETRAARQKAEAGEIPMARQPEPEVPSEEPARDAFYAGAVVKPAPTPASAAPNAGQSEDKESGAAGFEVRAVARRTFRMSHGVWIQDGYSQETPEMIDPGSARFTGIVKLHPELGQIVHLGGPVTFELDGQWYTLAKPVSD